MLISDFLEHLVLIGQNDIGGALVRYLEVLPNFLLRVDHGILYSDLLDLDAVELVDQALEILTHAKRGKQVDISINHDEPIELLLLATRGSAGLC